MKNNFYNIPNDWYKEFNSNFNVSDTNTNTNSPELAEPRIGFLKGNLFNNLYDPYKNYQYGNLSAKSTKEELLYNILMYQFALIDLDLYLDNYPFDTKCLNIYQKYLIELKKLTNQYEKNYEPLTLNSDFLGDNSWKWIKSPWPWEGTK